MGSNPAAPTILTPFRGKSTFIDARLLPLTSEFDTCVDIGGPLLVNHPLRATVLGEVHARPFHAIPLPRRIFHFAFSTNASQIAADRAALTAFCISQGWQKPDSHAKHFRIATDHAVLRWEQHSEFTTYTFECALAPAEADAPFAAEPSRFLTLMRDIPPPGELLVAINLQLMKGERDLIDRVFDPSSLAAAMDAGREALFASDFCLDEFGFVRMLVLTRDLSPESAGMLVQRLLEIETYRTFALLGLPVAQKLAPDISRIERRLADLTEEMRHSVGLSDNRRRLDELTALAAELEAGAAASLFRFGASRAYNELVQLRLQGIGEQPISGVSTWGQFLQRRMAPAIRTCAALEDRQANLSRKLARAAQLLRTRVDIELEQQNSELLSSMNQRVRLQLRLQQTVEGLSVAAISYYVVGLIGYIIKGAHDAGLKVEPSIATAAAVPVVVLAMWIMIRWIRNRHIDAPGLH